MSAAGLSSIRHLAACVGASLLLGGCGSIDLTDLPVLVVSQTSAARDANSHILFVLFDGTRNDPSSRTNVFLLKEAIEASQLPATVLYIGGVGSPHDPPLLGAALGMGMEARIHAAYRFLSEAHRPTDRIVVMGFSRGAHQARALAGLVAYAGLLDTGGLEEPRLDKQANAVIDAVKDFTDAEVEREWQAAPDQPPRRMDLERRLKIRLRAAPIAFLGLWDTVPGSSFKDYGECRELADGRKGERYKTGSYPGIARVAHAVALDEKRTKFKPILLCPAVVPSQTVVKEVWFAGAHADVGGGYQASGSSLSRVSLAWMAEELSGAIGVTVHAVPATEADEVSPAHWSMGDSPGNFGSHCADRHAPHGAVIHASVDRLRRAGSADLVVRGVPTRVGYPFTCDR